MSKCKLCVYQSKVLPSAKDIDAPTYLAHYTSLESLEKILIKKTLFLSNPLLMNDTAELRGGFALAYELLSSVENPIEMVCNKDIFDKEFMQEYRILYDAFNSTGALDVYVLCLAKHYCLDCEGVLSMWRGYAAEGNGVAIIFNRKLLANGASGFTSKAVNYASKGDQKRLMEDILGGVAAKIKAGTPIKTAASDLFEEILDFSLFTKHEAFHEENEWRIVYHKAKDKANSNSNSFTYIINSKGVELKFQWSRDDLNPPNNNSETLIQQILLGPTQSSTLAKASIQRMLEVLKCENLVSKVMETNIPYRPR